MSEGLTVVNIRGEKMVPLARTSSCAIYLYDQGRRAVDAGRFSEALDWFLLCCEHVPVERMMQPESFQRSLAAAKAALAAEYPNGAGAKIQAAALTGLRECDAWEEAHPGEFA